MASGDDFTKKENHCYHFYGNGFNLASIAILFSRDYETIRMHMDNGKAKTKSTTHAEAHGKLVEAKKFNRMHYDEKQYYLKRLAELKLKYPKKKKKKRKGYI